MEVYLDTTVSGQWSRHNATQRLGHAKYIAWTYIPSLVFVLYGVLWQVIDGETKRLEKYRQLDARSGNGTTAAQSLCLNYHSFWSPLAIIQALRYKQWSVALSSTGLVLSSIVLPNLQNYVLTWDVYCGQSLPWGAQDCVQLAYADEYWSKCLIGALAATLACALGLLWSLAKCPMGLKEDPRGLEFVVALTAFPDNRDLTDLQNDFVKDHSSGKVVNPRLSVLKIEGLEGDNPRLEYVDRKDLVTRSDCSKLQKAIAWISEHLKIALLAMFNLILLVTMAGAIYVLVQMNTPQQDLLQDYHLPWPPNLYLVVGVFVQVRAPISHSTPPPPQQNLS